jgi:hypothetical protein
MLDTKKVQRAAVPIVMIETNDAAQSMTTIAAQLNGKATSAVFMQHDLASGLRPLNEVSGQFNDEVFGRDIDLRTMPIGEVLMMLASEPALRFLKERRIRGFVLLNNPQLYWDEPTGGAQVQQAIWNLRDLWKPIGAQIYLLVPPATTLPEVMRNDTIVLTDTLPDRAELSEIIKRTIDQLGVNYDISKTCDTLSGLSAFAAEQVLAMSVSKTGVDMAELWERKRRTIEATPGLKVYRGGDTFNDVGGYENIKAFLTLIKDGRCPKLLVFEDEVDKAYGGVQGDTSGVAQDQLGAQLKYMQDNDCRGIIFFGVRGSGKTAVAKAMSNEFGVPTIEFDRGAMKGSLVGQSESRFRAALDVIKAVSNGDALFVATCNRMGALPPELLRRYNYGTYFFDLPDREARAKIWAVYFTKYPELFDQNVPNDAGWSGSDIRTCALLAHDLKVSLTDAASYIVPIGISSRDNIEVMRREAHNRYIDAARPGVYQDPAQAKFQAASAVGVIRNMSEVE